MQKIKKYLWLLFVLYVALSIFIWSRQNQNLQKTRNELAQVAQELNECKKKENRAMLWFSTMELAKFLHEKQKLDVKTEEAYSHFSKLQWPISYDDWKNFESFAPKVVKIAMEK